MILSALIPLSLHHRQHRISQSVLSSYKEKGYCRNRIMPSLRLYALCSEINPRFISWRYSYGQSLNLLLTKLAKKKEAGNPLPANFPDAQNPEEPVLSNIHTAKLVQTPRLCRSHPTSTTWDDATQPQADLAYASWATGGRTIFEQTLPPDPLRSSMQCPTLMPALRRRERISDFRWLTDWCSSWDSSAHKNAVRRSFCQTRRSDTISRT